MIATVVSNDAAMSEQWGRRTNSYETLKNQSCGEILIEVVPVHCS
jgi:hypothetical protein